MNERTTTFPAAIAAGGPVRLAIGSLIVLTGLAAALQAALAGPAGRLLAAGATPLAAAAVAGAATGLGALVLLAPRPPGRAGLERFFALAAGMMLAAALFSLLLPAVAAAHAPLALDAVLAAALGWAAMAALDRRVPHRHSAPAAAGQLPERALALLVAGIAVHNLPEGFAVGAGFGGGDALGWSTAMAIGLQNVPEGLVVATALWAAGLSRTAAALAALGTGLLEPVGAAAGVLLVGAAAAVLPVALALAAGAMAYVVVDELLPAVFRRGGASGRAPAFVAGLVAMTALAGA